MDVKQSLLDPARRNSDQLTPELLDGLGKISDETNRQFGYSEEGAGNTSGSASDPTGFTPDHKRPDLPRNTGSIPTSFETDHTNELPSRNDLPPIPDRDTDSMNDTDRRYYTYLLSNPDNQPGIMRRMIWEKDEITQGELYDEVIRISDTSDSRESGSLAASLRVLWRTTGEVKKDGRGDSAILTWVGRSDN